jgi:hypothetical protein
MVAAGENGRSDRNARRDSVHAQGAYLIATGLQSIFF